mmetsp:Transcript_52586/g.105366  ORF Transcript_52586/g.105366 Transcript_52586/m.105366 type:complete len:81 (-) Transcript_52586:537-779(-)
MLDFPTADDDSHTTSENIHSSPSLAAAESATRIDVSRIDEDGDEFDEDNFYEVEEDLDDEYFDAFVPEINVVEDDEFDAI